MARGFRLPRLLAQFQAAVIESGGGIAGDLDAVRRPARIQVTDGDRTVSLILYPWSLSPDGPSPPRPRGRQRVQMTGVDSLRFDDGWTTAVVGFDHLRSTFVFWDARVHAFFSPGSPSLHVQTKTVERARVEGLAVEEKATDGGPETITAVHVSRLLDYLLAKRDGRP